MKAYKLVEKRNDNVSKIAYKIEVEEGPNDCFIYLLDPYDSNRGSGIYMGGTITETKRGWTILTSWLTSRPVKIFLPRENFEKIEL